jgi:membrane protease YdiL (CAAX protease family)
VSRAFQAARGGSLVVAFLGSVLAPAVIEELLCRGLVQRSVARAAGPLAALAISTTLFGVIHMEWKHGLVAAAIGLYLGLAAYWADSTRPAILAHGLNNLGALLASQGLLRLHTPLHLTIGVGFALAAAGLVWAGWAHALRVRRARAALQREPDPADT